LSNVVENQIIELGFEIFSNKLYAHHTSPEEVKFPNVSAIAIRYSKCSSCLTFENFCLHTKRVLGEAEIHSEIDSEIVIRQLLQGDEDVLECRSFFTKEPLLTGILGGK